MGSPAGFVTVALTLLMCACSPGSARLAAGKDAYQAGDIKTAVSNWFECAREGNGQCMSLIGAAYEEGKIPDADPRRRAIGWYTLSARHGFPWAATRLTELGQPVPPADLAPRQTSPQEQAALNNAAFSIGEALGAIMGSRR